MFHEANVPANGERKGPLPFLPAVAARRHDGTAFAPPPLFPDMTCGNWTKSSTEGFAMLGHHDRAGPIDLRSCRR
jgi:hypothetical protein